MMNDKQWDDLMAEHEIAYLRGDLATGSPESYTVEEMKEISEGMDASTAEVEAALREDFATMPPQLQACMLDLLRAHDPDMAEWWQELLIGKMPDSPEELMALNARVDRAS